MSFEGSTLVDWPSFAKTKAELGADLLRILGYFREDGVKSVSAIEDAMRAGNAAGLVIPAHTLKGEARQFGAFPLADLAEKIEFVARDLVETRDTPEAVLEDVVGLRPLFTQTLALLEREATPVRDRRPVLGFGRRPVQGGGFGRA
ncbi:MULTISPECIES: Hpt domain-containing protein [unclassified Sphingomonas]|uniref:Hpt domain-containing protein n=1 Tax=unclassified Sphingomonas TaxID=196159 RepID=UPI001D0F879A|nr:Hpt domain-containing protein [Sphingomonas sp. IC4-52]MCC2979600.1 Hpt domain-containing protein [Sphingomonas sp. IC4-52]MCD2315170.1 Hpt domain-containing protein [Sphingomonas sp. IC-11]